MGYGHHHEDQLDYERWRRLVVKILENNTRECDGFRENHREGKIYLVRQISDLVDPTKWTIIELIGPVTDFLLDYKEIYHNCFEDGLYETYWETFKKSEMGLRLSKFLLWWPPMTLGSDRLKRLTCKSGDQHFHRISRLHQDRKKDMVMHCHKEYVEEESRIQPIKRQGTLSSRKETCHLALLWNNSYLLDIVLNHFRRFTFSTSPEGQVAHMKAARRSAANTRL
jgi:hypothetical protein